MHVGFDTHKRQVMFYYPKTLDILYVILSIFRFQNLIIVVYIYIYLNSIITYTFISKFGEFNLFAENIE